eukprot:TRINITY_DN4432_c0_g2_i1.p1 TRINITY_DN4432_c0_g2~~TRINITY_DN4432_c0_g2_i1.p1  ORF type:complete len:326 (+),score=60.14 TRINITY_DN4432_c0_g2_i1:38-1015(+)
MVGATCVESSDRVLSRERSGKTPQQPQLTPQQYMEKALKALHLDPKDTLNEKGGQRRRGVSFRSEYRAMKNRKPRGRAPSMIHEPTKSMIPPKRRDAKDKITVVLDLDETLIYAREGPLYARPHIDLLLEFLKDHCETVVWTAGVKAYAQTIVHNIDPKGAIEHCVYRHKKWFTGCAGYQKDLSMLGRDMDKILIIENTPDCIRGNPKNGILVTDYEGGENPDGTIPCIINFLAALVDSKMTVPAFLDYSPDLHVQEMLTDLGDVYPVYTLKSDDSAVPPSSAVRPRVNRDLQIETNLPPDAVSLDVPISPGGSYHNDWINNVAI